MTVSRSRTVACSRRPRLRRRHGPWRPPPDRPRRPLRVPLLLPLPRLRPRNRRSREMAASESPPLVKARKAPRLTAKQEIQTIRNLPRVQRGIVIMKIAGVFLLAIGFEGLVTGQYWYSVVFVPLGVLVAMLPIRIRTGMCIACQPPLQKDAAICTTCGAPQMSTATGPAAAAATAPP